MTHFSNQRGMSLVMALAMTMVVFSLSVVSLSMVEANTKLTSAVYFQSVSMNLSEDGPSKSTPVLKESAKDGWIDELSKGTFYDEEQMYTLFGGINVDVSMRDNDDLDDSESDDVDKVFILTSHAYIPEESSSNSLAKSSLPENLAQSSLEVLVKYVGPDDEYAQETGGSTSNSYFEGEQDVSF